MKEKLNELVQAIIQGDSKKGEAALHEFLTSKVKQILAEADVVVLDDDDDDDVEDLGDVDPELGDEEDLGDVEDELGDLEGDEDDVSLDDVEGEEGDLDLGGEGDDEIDVMPANLIRRDLCLLLSLVFYPHQYLLREPVLHPTYSPASGQHTEVSALLPVQHKGGPCRRDVFAVTEVHRYYRVYVPYDLLGHPARVLLDDHDSL